MSEAASTFKLFPEILSCANAFDVTAKKMDEKKSVKLSGPGIIAELKKAQIQVVAALPDIVTSDGLLWPISKDPAFRLIRVCKEDEGISICAALSYTDIRAVMLMQHTGLLDSLNSIRATAIEYQQPICMMIGLQGKSPAEKIAHAVNYGVKIVKPILHIMGLKTVIIENERDICKIAPSISNAYKFERPVCFLLGGAPSLDGDEYD